MRRLLWGGIGALALVLLLEWAWPAGGGDAVPTVQTRRQAHGVALPARDTSAWVSAVLARPVFSQSRRPPRVVAAQRGQALPGQARLAGILITRTGRYAIFAPEGGGKPLVLGEGAGVNDSTIRRILPDSVVMASGTVLRPTYDRNRVATSTPPFQAFQPGFANPGFPNPGFPNPGFPQPGFPQPGYPNPGLPNPVFSNPGAGGVPPGESAAQPNVPQLPQGLRGNFLPQRRE